MNKEERKAYEKAYYQANKEKRKAYQKAYHEANKEKKKAYNKAWHEANKEKRKVSQKAWYEANREKILAKTKAWYEANKEKVLAYRIDYDKKRYKEDPVYRLLKNMRGGMWSVLSGRTKSSHTMEYVGMSPDELMNYLENKFTEGMTRDNYGEWHVDHIRPLASFDFTGPDREEQLHIAWSYTNLQPLWAKDNLSKGATYEEG
tara:strand:+ start:325 stop:933 length:609 start_codon:yes stop_codon:yes gene_type:complete